MPGARPRGYLVSFCLVGAAFFLKRRKALLLRGTDISILDDLRTALFATVVAGPFRGAGPAMQCAIAQIPGSGSEEPMLLINRTLNDPGTQVPAYQPIEPAISLPR